MIIRILDQTGVHLATIEVDEESDGWYYGTLIEDQFSDNARRVLNWYLEVVEYQMLSLADEAINSVQQLGLAAQFGSNDPAKTYSFLIDNTNRVCFRTTPTL